MADQAKLLQLLAENLGTPMSIDAILKGLRGGRKAELAHRGRTVGALGKLVAKKFVARAGDDGRRPKSFSDRARPRPLYCVTPAGLEFLNGGKKVASYRGKWTAPTRVRERTDRQKFWSALRIYKKATLADLAETKGGDQAKAVQNARKYLKGLARAGIVVRLQVRAQGFAPTSNGFHRYAIARDLGPLAPVVALKGVFDPNSKETIPYVAEAPR
jgi:hypothetical protein